jgi:hypothetical protein
VACGKTAKRGLFEVVDLDAGPVGVVAGDEFLVEGVVLIEVVGGGVVEGDGQADGVGVVDDVAGGHGGVAGLELADGGDLGEEVAATGGETLGFIGGGGGFEPEEDGVDEHGIRVAGWGRSLKWREWVCLVMGAKKGENLKSFFYMGLSILVFEKATPNRPQSAPRMTPERPPDD